MLIAYPEMARRLRAVEGIYTYSLMLFPLEAAAASWAQQMEWEEEYIEKSFKQEVFPFCPPRHITC
jgi:hypothetical protein